MCAKKSIQIVLIILCSAFSVALNAQTGTAGSQTNSKTDSIYVNPETTAHFKEGDAAFYQFLSKNIVYPTYEKDKNISGKVYVRFIVEADGSITHVEVVRGLSPGVDNEAARVVKLMDGMWTPGMSNGVAVRQYFTLPFNFQFESSKKVKKTKSKK